MNCYYMINTNGKEENKKKRINRERDRERNN
jgi:hypothetical protein